jgi:hypothetical protein
MLPNTSLLFVGTAVQFFTELKSELTHFGKLLVRRGHML